MKRLKEKIVDFRNRHKKGLERVHKALNVFLVVIISLIVGLFMVGAVKGCTDQAKTDIKSSLTSQPKNAAVSGDFYSGTAQSEKLFSSDDISLNHWYSWSSNTSVNYAYAPSSWQTNGSLVFHAPEKLIFSGLSDSFYFEDDYAYLTLSLTIFSFDNGSLSFPSFALDLSNSYFNFVSNVSSTKYKFLGRADNSFYGFSNYYFGLELSLASVTSFYLEVPYLAFTSFPRLTSFIALSAFVTGLHNLDTADIVEYPNLFLMSEINSTFQSNILQKYIDTSSESYQIGFENGVSQGSLTGYDNGYDAGLISGKNLGYQEGYQIGYSNGSNVNQKNTLQGLFLTAFQAPFHMFQQFFNINILGLNLGSLFIGLIVILICGFVIRRLI